MITAKQHIVVQKMTLTPLNTSGRCYSKASIGKLWIWNIKGWLKGCLSKEKCLIWRTHLKRIGALMIKAVLLMVGAPGEVGMTSL
mgnify:CR=1 FL=1